MNAIVKEARGRRVFPSSPDNSLLLVKAAGVVAHGGGKRLTPETEDYQTLRRWILQGMPVGDAQAPTFRTETTVVQLPVRVLDAEGGFVKDLAAADIEVLEDGVPQAVAEFTLIDMSNATGPSPLTVYLLAYTSTNNKSDGKYRRTQVNVKRPGVQAFYRSGYLARRP